MFEILGHNINQKLSGKPFECYNKMRDYIITIVIRNPNSNYIPLLLLSQYGYQNPANMPINLSIVMVPNQPMSSMAEGRATRWLL